MSDSPASIPDLDRLRRLAAGTGWAQAVDRAGESDDEGWLDRGLPRGRLHEIYGAEAGDAAAAAGFAAGLALVAEAMPLIWIRPEGGERVAGRLHATGLAELGLAPDRLVLVLVADQAALLRAAADAARCAGLGALVMESWGPVPALDLTATRRLVLAAEASGVTVLSLRLAADPVPSAAATRWRIAARPSVALEADAPGAPVFDVECLRRRGGPAGARRCVEWNRETRTFLPHQPLPFAHPVRPEEPHEAPLAGAGLPLAADRAAARHASAPFRRSG